MQIPFRHLKKPRFKGLKVLVGLILLTCSNAWCNPLLTVNLSGTWSFTPLGGTATTIQVPGGGWYKQGFTSVNEADYQTAITIPNSGQLQITKIEFGAINYEADLYINNVLVGSSITSFTPSCFDISAFVTPGQSYTLRVHVKGKYAFITNGKSSVPNAAGWSPNTPQGIFRYALLKVYPQTYISNVFVRPSIANTDLYYDVWITNGSLSQASLVLSSNLSSWNSSPWLYPSIPNQTVSVPAGTTTKVTIGPISWNLGSGSYWWPNVPYQSGYIAQLHNLNLILNSGANTVDSTTTRFGFRDIIQKSDGTNTCYLLNGIRVNFRGDSLQGADFDSINYGGGPGDCYDTLPGFLPGTNGWPQAVDNYEHLNYNFIRIHQYPASPYMLDICDQMGLMIIEETAIRGSNNDQDFVVGHDNMINHLMALYSRDRNHPCIVRQSLSNEPGFSSTDSTQFETDLYNAAMSVDGTRPLSIDQIGGNTYETMNYSNFNVIQHYGDGFAQFTQQVWARPDRPYGEGEFIWNADNTAQGFAWFSTSAQAMRAQGASDIRPYTLLSAWVGFVPGVKTTDMTLEQGGHPLYGIDNLPSPWTNPQIQRVQAGFNPVLVADSTYWDDNEVSDSAGDWPSNVHLVKSNQTLTRSLNVYNDTFSGTAVSVLWQLAQGSPSGTVVASGQVNLTVALGYVVNTPITFTIPNSVNGTVYYLVLSTQKAGVQIFQETAEQFTVKGLAGTPFGASPPFTSGREFDKASDGDITTFYDYSQSSGGYTGIDLGAGNTQAVNSITFSPRSGFESRMAGGVFQGSNDGVNYTPLYTITAVPSNYSLVNLTNTTPYRYLEYIGPANSYCDIAEMEFDASASNLYQLTGTAFGSSPPYSANSGFSKATDGNINTFYDYSQPNDGYTGLDLGAGNAQTVNSIIFSPRRGFESRMVGGVFQGSNDGVNYTPLYTVTSVPSANTQVSINNPTPYRYLEYVGPRGSYCDIAEMEFETFAPTLQSAASIQIHSGTPYPLPLPLTGSPGVECRAINGSLHLVFTFNQPITSGTSEIVNGTGNISGTPLFSGNTMTINLSGVADAQNFTIQLSNLNGVNSINTISFGVLLGDVNGDGGVNSQDVILTRNAVGTIGGQSAFNPKTDINEDGGVNSQDVILTRNAVGHVLH